MLEIDTYLAERGLKVTEGSSSEIERDYLVQVVSEIGAANVCEIGFNGGYSAYALLASNPDLKVTSFDLGGHEYARVAKEYIDQKFPGRHTIIWGDSRKTVPAHQPERPFDAVFIDGGHRYNIAKADIRNMQALCVLGAVVIMDDLVPWKYYGAGPTLAWRQALRAGIVVQDEIFKDGDRVDRVLPPGKRAWARGRYVQ